MKKITKLIVAAFMLTANTVSAQEQQVPNIPIDPQVRVGKLENGLTYYIRHNEEPKDRQTSTLPRKLALLSKQKDKRDWLTSWNTCVLTEQKNSPEIAL